MNYDEGVSAGEQALAIATALGDRALEIPANSYLGLLFEAKGDYRRAASFLERNVGLPERELGHQRFGQATVQSAFSRHHLAHVLCELGQFAEALVHARDAMRIAEAAEQAYTLAFACFDSGFIHLRKGELPAAITVLERGREICERGQITILAPGIAALLGFAVALSGRMSEALPLVEWAARDAVVSQQRYRHLVIVRLLGGVYLMAGRFTEALERAQEVLVLARRHGERSQQAYVLSLLGNIAVDREPSVFESAQEHYHEAIALAGDLGMRPLVGDCHLGLGKLYRRTGKRKQAHEHLTTATTMYREMDMPFWLERAEAEIREP